MLPSHNSEDRREIKSALCRDNRVAPPDQILCVYPVHSYTDTMEHVIA